jgi:hypothetical protein
MAAAVITAVGTTAAVIMAIITAVVTKGITTVVVTKGITTVEVTTATIMAMASRPWRTVLAWPVVPLGWHVLAFDPRWLDLELLLSRVYIIQPSSRALWLAASQMRAKSASKFAELAWSERSGSGPP